ncbi:HD-GYP domain-containing protein (c-di-GMP phosphodiesterase class II) [Kushneria sinocarnis]|uniref:HD-GYP domain-containing protein (C-di-GMP phosphodiesterase class II) n=1 Tax=Kushneria sinocarnis TaxID=595502 RepID=A0A420X160_9GAMM|nr:HD domain-containing phosphohydrolase [Kushneria sinocarnis]RKR07514.1 HD-GYP domain-containing protein (c-di-GMP phosphodiesterase class II) [Kushneria sinocarnis]
METRESQPQQQTESLLQIEIRDTAHIATVVDTLSDATHTLTITLPATSLAYPASIRQIEPERNLLTLSLLDAQALDADALDLTDLTLCAETIRETLQFDTFEITDCQRDHDTLAIHCRFPGRLRTSSKRRSVRLPFIRGMQARVRVRVFADQPALEARIRNLSAGGCLLEVPLRYSAAFRLDEWLPEISITFPNRQNLTTTGRIRHVHPAGRSHFAAVGIAFGDMATEEQAQLMHFVNEVEREAAYRAGEGGRMAWPSPLFASDEPGYRRNAHQRDRKPRGSTTPMVTAVHEIARQLHVTQLALQNQQPIPCEALRRSTTQLLQLLQKNRQVFLYALCCLQEEPQWIQHSLTVAGHLADLMMAEPEHAERVGEAVMAALLHDMGKALLISEELTTLEGPLTAQQKVYLKGHVEVMLDALASVTWLDAGIRHEVIGCINERLDGTGYPAGFTAGDLTPVARMAAVIDAIDAMRRPRGDRQACTAIEAYRFLYNRPARFDKWWVTRYIQRHGFYPIGSLVKFSRGFLAWVLELDQHGQPERIRVVLNTARNRMTMDDVLGRVDFAQLGRLEGLAQPEQYGLSPY